MKYKICLKCQVEKPLSENYFYKHKLSKNGYLHICKSCQKEKSSRQWEKIKSNPLLYKEEKNRKRMAKKLRDIH